MSDVTTERGKDRPTDRVDDDRSILPDVQEVTSLSTRICAFMLIAYALYYARSLFIPITTSLVLYLALRPIVRHIRRLGVPPPLGAIAIIGLVVTLLALGTYSVVQPARETIKEAPRHLSVMKEKLSFITERMEDVDKATEQLAETEKDSGNVDPDDEPVPVEIKQPTWTSGWSYLSGTGNVVSFLTICVAMLYFLLATGDDLLRSIMRGLPDFTARRRLIEGIEKVQEGLGSYLAQVSAINASLGIAVGIAMWILGMPSPALWGAMAFAFNFIPIVGAIAGAAIIFMVALVNFDPTYYAFVVTATFVSLTTLEGQFITPAILGRSMAMSPVLVFLSIVVWGWMWGMMGVFLSVPILIAARMACEAHEGLQPLAMILGAEVPTPNGEDEPSTREEPTDEVDTREPAAATP